MSRRKNESKPLPTHFTFVLSEWRLEDAFHVDVPDDQITNGIDYALGLFYKKFHDISSFYIFPFNIDDNFVYEVSSDE